MIISLRFPLPQDRTTLAVFEPRVQFPMERLISWVQQNPQTNVPILVAVIGVGSALLAGFFTVVIWPFAKIGLERVWHFGLTRISQRGFEDIYLRRLIRRYRLLPMLPTTLVPVTDKPIQELDNLYVELEITNSSEVSQITKYGPVLKQNRLVVVLGDPGAGKTTMALLNFVWARRREG
jgi:hypothetical protein